MAVISPTFATRSLYFIYLRIARFSTFGFSNRLIFGIMEPDKRGENSEKKTKSILNARAAPIWEPPRAVLIKFIYTSST